MAQFGDVTIRIITEESKQYLNEISEKPIESKAEIADHINHKPVELTIDFVIVGDDAEEKRNQLIEMRDSDEVYSYTNVKNLKIFEDMAIQSLSISDNKDYNNGYSGSMSLKQIRVAEQTTTTVNLGQDPVTGMQAQAASGETEKRESGTENVDEDTVDEAFLYSLFGG